MHPGFWSGYSPITPLLHLCLISAISTYPNDDQNRWLSGILRCVNAQPLFGDFLCSVTYRFQWLAHSIKQYFSWFNWRACSCWSTGSRVLSRPVISIGSLSFYISWLRERGEERGLYPDVISTVNVRLWNIDRNLKRRFAPWFTPNWPLRKLSYFKERDSSCRDSCRTWGLRSHVLTTRSANRRC